MRISSVDTLKSVAAKHPGLTAAYIGVVIVIALEFVFVPRVVNWSVPGLIRQDGKKRKQVAVLFFVVFALFVLYIVDSYITTRYSSIIKTEVESRVVAHILASDSVGSGNSERGAWTYNTIEYAWELNMFIRSVRLFWVTPFVFLAATTGVLWQPSDWIMNALHGLQFLVAVGTPLVVVFGHKRPCRRVEELTMKRYSYLDDVYQNAKTVVSHDGQSRELAQLKANADTQHAAEISLETALVGRILFPCTLVVMVLFFCSILRAIRLKLTELATRDLLLVITLRLYYVGLFAQSGHPIMSQYSVLTSLADKLKCREVCSQVAGPLTEADWSSGLQFNDVSFVYPGSTEPTIQSSSISFPINSGTALVGKSGSGKSTVMNLLKGFLSPTDGSITLHGMPLATYPHRNRVVGFVMQHPQIFNTTVWENIGYGCPEFDRKGIEDKLREYGWHKVLADIGLDLDSQTGKGGDRLSGGQRQIVQLLRVLILDPGVLLLDEPTAALDDDNSKMVMGFITSVIKSKIVVMVTHDTQLVSYMDRTIYL
jgi:ABC-type bacteriocin/lantibiotic exporter with double-glycine peptidase domain